MAKKWSLPVLLIALKFGSPFVTNATSAWAPNKSLERAQAKVEGRNFDIRKQLLKFDDVMNDQRKAIFSQRLD